MIADITGWLASIFTTMIFAPQLVKAVRTRSTGDISMLMLILSVIGNLCWFIHAMMISNMPLLVCAVLIVIMSLFLIAYKFYNEKSVRIYSN